MKAHQIIDYSGKPVIVLLFFSSFLPLKGFPKTAQNGKPVTITDMKLQHKFKLLALEDNYLIFSWKMNSPFTVKKQTTNRIVVIMENDKSMDPEIIAW